MKKMKLYLIIQKINRVINLSDIHIKNGEHKYKQYSDVFDNVCEQFKKLKICEKDVIVITGNILDNRYFISASGIQLVKKFYDMILSFTDCITVLENHQVGENYDILSSLLKNIKTDNNYNYILCKNNIYLYGNLAFSHTLMTEDIVTSCNEYSNVYTTISLHNSTLNGSKFSDAYVCVKNGIFSVRDFKSDYAMIGGIHKMQFLNTKKLFDIPDHYYN